MKLCRENAGLNWGQCGALVPGPTLLLTDQPRVKFTLLFTSAYVYCSMPRNHLNLKLTGKVRPENEQGSNFGRTVESHGGRDLQDLGHSLLGSEAPEGKLGQWSLSFGFCGKPGRRQSLWGWVPSLLLCGQQDSMTGVREEQ